MFLEWLLDRVIEEVTQENWDVGHYLLHWFIFKIENTTLVQPVFATSVTIKDQPSLNPCLEKGVGLIELIPKILLQFPNLDFIGVIFDIKKAFLQIALNEGGRDFLWFLWMDG